MRIVLAVLIKRPLDRLLDPVAGVGREARADGRVEAFDRPQQAQVALLDQVLQAQALAGISAGDVDHQAEVGADHAVAGLRVAAADGHGQFVLVVGREQRGLVDLAEVGLQGRLHGCGLAAACLGHRHLSCQRAGKGDRRNFSAGHHAKRGRQKNRHRPRGRVRGQTDYRPAKRRFCKEAGIRRARGTVAGMRTVAKTSPWPRMPAGGPSTPDNRYRRSSFTGPRATGLASAYSPGSAGQPRETASPATRPTYSPGSAGATSSAAGASAAGASAAGASAAGSAAAGARG